MPRTHTRTEGVHGGRGRCAKRLSLIPNLTGGVFHSHPGEEWRSSPHGAS
ncbi:hypothetical protein BQ8420_21505 [Nocardiopsis sp. JB363]|nr:hypothetical protein BQ8420_21505 [Nocardiopsis sp. JB363]